MVTIDMVTFSALSVLKHGNFYSFTFELGMMSQVLGNTSHCRLLELALDRSLDTPLADN